jgi:hypothetical protein
MTRKIKYLYWRNESSVTATPGTIIEFAKDDPGWIAVIQNGVERARHNVAMIETIIWEEENDAEAK